MKFEIEGEAKEGRKIRMRFDVRNQFDCAGEWLVVCLEDKNGRRAWSSAIRVKLEVENL